MLRFKVHQFHLKGTHYLLLPKLNPVQMRIIATRLAKLGRLLPSTELVSAKLREGSLHVDPKGLCWARFDPADAILPLVPDLLSCRKVEVSSRGLRAKYYQASRLGGATSIRFSLRLESGSLWRTMRALGECALAPDEHEVAASLLRTSARTCKMVTDYPEEGSAVLRIWGKRYFESNVDPAKASQTLRVVGVKAPRNSYIPADGVLRLDDESTSPEDRSARLFDSLGEWCFFAH